MHVWEAEILSANFDQVREKSHKLHGHAMLSFRVFMAQVKRQRSLGFIAPVRVLKRCLRHLNTCWGCFSFISGVSIYPLMRGVHWLTSTLNHLHPVRACWQAMERFVLCGSIAAGLLQWLSVKYNTRWWEQQVLYLRTRSRDLPSENTVRQILASLLARKFNPARRHSQWWSIYEAVNDENEDEEELCG